MALFRFNRAKTSKFVFHDDFTDGIGLDKALHGVFDAHDATVYRCLYFASFKGKIGVFHPAVFKHESLAVAKRLGSLDCAVDKTEVFGIPREIFAFEHTVFARNISCMPECVLGLKNGIFDDYILDILERIFARHAEFINVHISAFEEGILADELGIGDFYVSDLPCKFFRIDSAAGKNDVVAFAKRLDAAEDRIGDLSVFVIPERGSAGFGHFAV